MGTNHSIRRGVGKVFLAGGVSMCLAQPAGALEPWDAFVSAGGGYTVFDLSDLGSGAADFDDWYAEARGSAAYRFADGFGVQADVEINHQKVDVFGAEDFANRNTDVALHSFYGAQTWLAGAFVQYGLSSLDTDFTGPRYADYDRFYAGAEGQYYFDRTTLYAQAGVMRYDNDDLNGFVLGYDGFDGFFLNGAIRYFPTDNLRLALTAGYDALDVAGFDYDVIKLGGLAEYRFDAAPLSTFLNVEYRRNHYENDVFEASLPEVRLLAGFKLNFGAATLLERDRAGATLDPMRAGGLGGFTILLD